MTTVRSHLNTSRTFLDKTKYLGEGDLHQASEKGWGAAAHMAKATSTSSDWWSNRCSESQSVRLVTGWDFTKHRVRGPAA